MMLENVHFNYILSGRHNLCSRFYRRRIRKTPQKSVGKINFEFTIPRPPLFTPKTQQEEEFQVVNRQPIELP